jgi:hypothetical protein
VSGVFASGLIDCECQCKKGKSGSVPELALNLDVFGFPQNLLAFTIPTPADVSSGQ